MVELELLYFDGCPSWRHAWADLGDVLAELRIEASLKLTNLASLAPEERVGFGGSPTLRIDGRDLEGYDGPPLEACRVYLSNGGQGWPDPERVKEAVRLASDGAKG